MLRDITIGQYYPVDSVIHRLDPRTKLAGTLVFILSLFLFRSYAAYGVSALFLASVIRASRVPFSFMVRGLKSVIVLLLITVGFNLFLTPGTPLVHIWKLTITQEGVRTAVFMALRLVFLIIGSSIMTLTTTPNRLTDGMETALAPLNRIHVPVHEMAMILSIALRFIPILIEETDKIMKAQMARGADFESGNFLQKAKNMIPLLVPLFVSAFRRANDLAIAMEARGYFGGEGRTKMRPLRYQKGDAIAYAALAGYLLAMYGAKTLAGFLA